MATQSQNRRIPTTGDVLWIELRRKKGSSFKFPGSELYKVRLRRELNECSLIEVRARKLHSSSVQIAITEVVSIVRRKTYCALIDMATWQNPN